MSEPLRVTIAPRFGRLRRFTAHITRTTARNALWLTAISIVLYAVVRRIPYEPIADPIGQILLIMAGVAAGAVFLPELSDGLWSLTASQVRQLIPGHKRTKLSRVLIAAESDDEDWNELVYNEALVPLVKASVDKHEYVKNMTYSVQAHLNEVATIAGRDLRYHSIETQSRSERVLPPHGADGTYWVSVARTDAALKSEFATAACLAREVVSLEDDDGHLLTGDDWRKAMEELCAVSVTVNGEVQELRIEAGLEGEVDVLRWKFRPDTLEGGVRVPIYIGFDFPIRTTEDRFPVYFKGFYCAGATVVSMKVFNLPANADLRCDTFFAHGLKTHRHRNEDEMQGLLCKQRSFSTGRDSILWPGSGVIFDWHDCKASHA